MERVIRARRRSVRRGPFRLALAAALVAGFVALAGTVRADDEPVAPPYESEGDLSFYVDINSFRADEGKVEQEIYLSISNDQLAFEPVEEESFEGSLFTEAVIRAPDGEEVFRQETELSPRAGSELDSGDRAIVQLVRETVALAPGRYHLWLKVVDRWSEKDGLWHKIRGTKKKGEVSTWFEVASLDSPELKLSEPALLRDARRVDPGSPFARNGVEYDPNPSRYYGLAVPSVRYYSEVYGGDSFQRGDSFIVTSELQDRGGTPFLEQKSRAKPSGASFVVTQEVPLDATVTGGTYDLVVGVFNERTGESYETRREIEVIWGVESWGRDPEEVVAELALIMTDQEHKTLQKLSPGAAEVYIAEFWHGLDPDPSTPENPIYINFRRRVFEADRRYSGSRRGIQTDQGRVFVRYGPPDDVDYQFSSSGFGPGTGQRVADPGERATLQSRPNTSFLDADEFREGDVSDVARQRGSATVKSKQLEVWTYDGRGNSLRGKVDLQEDSHRGLKFIFADEMGNGEYQLIGSSGANVY